MIRCSFFLKAVFLRTAFVISFFSLTNVILSNEIGQSMSENEKKLVHFIPPSSYHDQIHQLKAAKESLHKNALTANPFYPSERTNLLKKYSSLIKMLKGNTLLDASLSTKKELKKTPNVAIVGKKNEFTNPATFYFFARYVAYHQCFTEMAENGFF